MGRKLTAALLAALMLCTAALAAEPPEPPAGEEVIREEEIREEPGEELELPAGEETGEEIELSAGEILEECSSDEVFQAGAISGPQTMPDEISMFASTLSGTIADGLRAQLSQIDISRFNATSAQVKEAYTKAMNDNPELFYVKNSWRYSSDGGKVTAVYPQYDSTLAGAPAQASFQTAVDAALAQVKPGMSDLDKILVLHDYLVVNCQYDWSIGLGYGQEGPNVYSAYGVLVNQNAVCQGYALAYKYLLNQAGVEAVLVSSNALNHAWNAVLLGGLWYYVDTTWDDPVCDFPGKAYHNNFLQSETKFREKHKNDTDWTPKINCSSTIYEEGYAFLGNQWPFYYDRNNQFYYIVTDPSADWRAQVKHGPLTGDGSTLTTITPFMKNKKDESGYYPGCFGVVWLNDCLYYVGADDVKLHCYSLLGYGEITSNSEIPYTGEDLYYDASTSEGQKQQRIQDFLGLLYRDNKIQAVSRADPLRTALISFSPFKFEYPPAWNEAGNGICGLTSDNTKAGIKWNGPGNAVLYAVSLENGRMTGVQVLPAVLRNGVTLVDLPKAVGSQWKLILASRDGASPLCRAQSGGN